MAKVCVCVLKVCKGLLDSQSQHEHGHSKAHSPSVLKACLLRTF